MKRKDHNRKNSKYVVFMISMICFCIFVHFPYLSIARCVDWKVDLLATARGGQPLTYQSDSALRCHYLRSSVMDFSIYFG